jgi:hypothetical protein
LVFDDISPGSTFLACVYDSKWWIGIVKDKSEEHSDFQVSFMVPSGEAKQYTWPETEDTCWVDQADIITTVSCPVVTSSPLRGSSLLESDIKRIKALFTTHQ